MTMPVSLASANIDAGPAGKFEGVHVETRGGRLKIRNRQGVWLLDVQAVAVRKIANRQYEADVIIEDEQVIVKFQRAGCGCGK